MTNLDMVLVFKRERDRNAVKVMLGNFTGHSFEEETPDRLKIKHLNFHDESRGERYALQSVLNMYYFEAQGVDDCGAPVFAQQ